MKIVRAVAPRLALATPRRPTRWRASSRRGAPIPRCGRRREAPAPSYLGTRR